MGRDQTCQCGHLKAMHKLFGGACKVRGCHCAGSRPYLWFRWW